MPCKKIFLLRHFFNKNGKGGERANNLQYAPEHHNLYKMRTPILGIMVIPNYKTGLMTLVLSAQGCLCVDLEQKQTQRILGSSLRDIKGDGKQDLVYCVTEKQSAKPGEETKIYRVFWKENLGEGKFSEEKLLFETNNQPNDYCR